MPLQKCDGASEPGRYKATCHPRLGGACEAIGLVRVAQAGVAGAALARDGKAGAAALARDGKAGAAALVCDKQGWEWCSEWRIVATRSPCHPRHRKRGDRNECER